MKKGERGKKNRENVTYLLPQRGHLYFQERKPHCSHILSDAEEEEEEEEEEEAAAAAEEEDEEEEEAVESAAPVPVSVPEEPTETEAEVRVDAVYTTYGE